MSWRRGEDSAVTVLHGPEPEQAAGPPVTPPLPQRLGTWRKVAIAGILLVLSAGLVWQLTGRDDSAGDLVTPTSVARSAPAASSVTPPQLDPATPPQVVTTGEDFDAIVRSHKALENWVYQFDPDPRWAPVLVDPGFIDEVGGFQRVRNSLALLQAAGQRHEVGRLRTLKVDVSSRVNEDHVLVYVVLEASPGRIIAADGTAVEDLPGLPPTGYMEQWLRRDDGQWHLVQSDALGPPAEGVLP